MKSDFVLRPARNICASGSDLYFLAREFNGLFCYSLDGDKLTYLGNAKNRSIPDEYQYSSLYMWDDSIFMVPVYSNRYAIYSIANKTFRYVYTKNCERKITFDNSVAFNEKIFCFPVWNDEPVVVFSMAEEAEKKEIHIPESYKKERRELYRVRKISDETALCLLYPGSIFFTINLSNETIVDDFVVDSINGNIDSFYYDDGLLFVHVEEEDSIVVLDEKGKIINRININTKGPVDLIGKWKGCLFADQIKSDNKVLIDINDDHRVCEFEDHSNGQYDKAINGVIVSQPDTEKDIYLSGNSGCIYESVESGVKLHRFMREDVKESAFYSDYMGRHNDEKLCYEDDILDLDCFLDILSQE